MAKDGIDEGYSCVSDTESSGAQLRSIFQHPNGVVLSECGRGAGNSYAPKLLAFLIAGVFIGTVAGVAVALLGASLLGALLAYSFAGSLGFVMLSMLFSE